MRLGGPVFGAVEGPDDWIELVRRSGYRAAYCPLKNDADDATVRAYERAAGDADIVIGEVGAWSNPLSRDEATRREAIDYCARQLDLADRIGARCCVNIAGSRGTKWDGPDPADLTEETFDLIVETVREIIDTARPTGTVYALETMPWMYPESADSYLRLIDAIDREAFGVHLDPVNLIAGPYLCFRNGDLIRECFEKLGPRIRSCHAKDIVLADRLTVHLDEARPGQGVLDYRTLLREMDRLDPDTPLLLEHLPNAEEYDLAAAYIREVAAAEAITL